MLTQDLIPAVFLGNPSLEEAVAQGEAEVRRAAEARQGHREPLAEASVVTAQPGRRPAWPPADGEAAGGLAAALFLLPSAVGFFIFTAFPVVAAIGLAFYDYDLLLGRKFNGLQNFRDLANDDVFRAALVNTVYFTARQRPAVGGARARRRAAGEPGAARRS